MLADPAQRRRMFYAIDRGYRDRRHNQAGGQHKTRPESRASWTRAELLEVLGIHVETFLKYQALGIIPRPTYPSRTPLRYWGHQAVLLMKLFAEMRKEGWPRRMPHFVGSPYWTRYLERLRSEWMREPDEYRKWKARCGVHHETGTDSTGEHTSV